MRHIQELLHRFEAVELHEISRVSLLKRRDTKYVFHANHLVNILQALTCRYRVLSVNQIRMQRYETLYFDTPSFGLYLNHHNGKLNRYKVRCRKYIDSDLTFLEIKFKSNKRITIKKRIRIPDLTTTPQEEVAQFMRTHLPFDPFLLEPKLWNSFVRITMISKYNLERLTLDIDLNFYSDENRAALPGIAIAEVKQPTFSYQSDFVQQMRKRHIYPTRFSKYCFGVTMIYNSLKSNNFKPMQRFIKKTMAQGGEDDRPSRSYRQVFHQLHNRNRYYPLHLLPAKP